MTTIHWTSGTACDFFLSLFVLHHAADFGVRPAWAAGVRQRLPAKSRETLERVFSFSSVPLAWISHLPNPLDAQTAISAIANLAPAERIPVLTLPLEMAAKVDHLLQGIVARGAWTDVERSKFISLYRRGPSPSSRGYENLLNTWTTLADNGEKYLDALQEYYDVFFVEEEVRIRHALKSGLAEAQSLARKLQPGKLVEHLSRGVRLENQDTLTDLTLLPSWWVTPLAFLARPAPGKTLVAFGIRPELQADADGAEAPEILVNTLKALGDPTRLRILRYLSTGPLSPSELARRLRLRPPTVTHHLKLLRIAGLVQVTISENLERRYAARPDAVKSIHITLQKYLSTYG
jgi:DNA-binding transcriptional ArsR family regulator